MSIAVLERRVALLEQELVRRSLPPAGAWPVGFAIGSDAGGTTTYNFSGHVHAAGLDLDAGSGATPPDTNRVRWLRAADGAAVASLYAFEDTPGGLAGGAFYADQRTLDTQLTLQVKDAATGLRTAFMGVKVPTAIHGLPSAFVAAQALDVPRAASATFLSADGGSDFPRVLFSTGALLDVVNDNTERSLLSTTINGGQLGTNRALRVTLELDTFNNSGVNQTSTFRIKYGAATLWGDAPSFVTNANRHTLRIAFELWASNATNAQAMNGYAWWGVASAGSVAGSGTVVGTPNGGPISGTSAVDSTADQQLVVSVQHTNALATLSCRRRGALVEAIGA